MTWTIWEQFHRWGPFKIDALGLVTLLGAEEINAAVGRLVWSSYFEYLPLLGAFVIAGDRFREKAAGFNLYNITQGIHTTELSGWLTRWMLSQGFETTRSFVVWTVTPPVDRTFDTIIAALISFVFNGILIAGAGWYRDWYGLANAFAMVASILVRAYIISANRQGIDKMIDEVMSKPAPKMPDSTYEHKLWLYNNEKQAMIKQRKAAKKKGSRQNTGMEEDGKDLDLQKSNSTSVQYSNLRHRKREHPKPIAKDYVDQAWAGNSPNDVVKIVVIMSDSKAVTMWLPQILMIPPSVFVESPKILHPPRYAFARWIAWLAFAVHIVAIGMAVLTSQLYTVALIVIPTMLIVWKIGCDDSQFSAKSRHWRQKAVNSGSNEFDQADETGSAGDFTKKSECWIGSRLKAEVYEWPASYEFVEVKHEGKLVGYETHVPDEDEERSKKRMDLYAWLQLSTNEEDSVDKWDLFPHIRDGNNKWWINYKMKKRALRPNPNFGPQKPSPDPVTDGSAPDEDANLRQLQKKDRTKTAQFNLPGQPHRSTAPTPSLSNSGAGQGAPTNSAFPASMNTTVSRGTEGNEHSSNSTQSEEQVHSTGRTSQERHTTADAAKQAGLTIEADSKAPDESQYRV